MFPTTAEAAYLRGLYDGEGSCHLYRSVVNGTLRVVVRAVAVTNTDEAIIYEATRCLGMLGLSYRMQERLLPSGKTAWTVMLYGPENLLKFQSLIGFTSESKAQRLAELLATYRPIGTRAGDKWVGRYDEIRQLRSQGLKLREIAERLGMPLGSVSHALKEIVEQTKHEISTTLRTCARAKCGKSFVPDLRHARTQQYCSGKCGQLDWAMRKRKGGSH